MSEQTKDWATEAARDIWADCLDRRGIKWECRKVNPDVLADEIIPAWAKIMRLAAIDQLQRMDGVPR